MKIHFTSSQSRFARQAFDHLTKVYGQSLVSEAEALVALGGDGHVLRTLYETLGSEKPVFALRRTESVGFLCNDYAAENLEQRITAAQRVTLHPLQLEAMTTDGTSHTAWAINEVTVLRETAQAARLRVLLDGVERIEQYSGDGILISTPAGSTAYNYSCGGPIMPLGSNTLVMTAICGFRPRGWSYAVLPEETKVEIGVLEIAKRPVRIEAGGSIIHNVTHAKIWHERSKSLHLLFDPGQHLGERIVREQFGLNTKG